MTPLTRRYQFARANRSCSATHSAGRVRLVRGKEGTIIGKMGWAVNSIVNTIEGSNPFLPISPYSSMVEHGTVNTMIDVQFLLGTSNGGLVQLLAFLEENYK